MRAMILAAGRGARMRPLTDTCPKPLLPVHGEPMLVRLIKQLVAARISELVINHAWLGEQIESAIGDGRQFGANVTFSPETAALETAGGISNALPLLGNEPFLVVNGDVFTDFDFSQTHQWQQDVQSGALDAVCTLVANPAHNPAGDFALDTQGLVRNPVSRTARNTLTYAGIAVFRPELFALVPAGSAAPLAPLLRATADQGRLGGVQFTGLWSDVGSPERLNELNARSTD